MKKILVLLLTLLLLVSCSEKPSQPALTCGSTEISREVFYSHLVNYKNDFLYNYLGIMEDNEAIWTQDSPGGRNENVAEAVTRMAVEDMMQFAWVVEYAVKNGAKVTDAEKAEIESSVKTMKEGFESEEEYNEYLKKLGLTEEEFKSYLESTKLYDKGFEALIGEGGEYSVAEEEYREYYDENFFTVKHIYLDDEYYYDENGTPVALTDEERLQKLTFANNLLTDLENGTSIDVLYMFSEDGAQSEYPNGITFGKGFTSDPSYEEAVLQMEIGERKIIQPDGGGIYVVERVVLLSEDYAEYEEYIKAAIYQEVSEKIYSDHKNEVSVNYDVVNSMNIIEMPVIG